MQLNLVILKYIKNEDNEGSETLEQDYQTIRSSILTKKWCTKMASQSNTECAKTCKLFIDLISSCNNKTFVAAEYDFDGKMLIKRGIINI